MTKDGKNLKLSCIACLFVGLAVLIVGIVAGVSQAFDADALATIACGVGGVPVGAQASRLANVPSNARRVRTVSIVALLVSAALLAVSAVVGDPMTLQLVALALAVLASLAMLIFSHRLVRELDRV